MPNDAGSCCARARGEVAMNVAKPASACRRDIPCCHTFSLCLTFPPGEYCTLPSVTSVVNWKRRYRPDFLRSQTLIGLAGPYSLARAPESNPQVYKFPRGMRARREAYRCA